MPTRNSESGFTLVELMVASLVTMLLMGVAFSTFKDALALNEAVVQVADSTQNLRAGTNLLIRDLMQAGRNVPIGGIGIPSGAGALAINRPGPPNTTPPLYFANQGESTTLTSITTGAGLGPVIAGRPTDIVTIVMDDPFLDELKLFPSNAGTTKARLAADGSWLDVGPHKHWVVGSEAASIAPIKAGDLIYFSSNGSDDSDNPTGSGTTLQTVTKVDGTVVFFEPNDPFKFNQRNVSAGSITQMLPAPCSTAPGAICEGKTVIRRVHMLTYFVFAEPENPDVPRLMRRLNFAKEQALAGVIEDLDLSYDLVDGVNNPVNVESLPFSAFGVTYKPTQIRKVNVHVGVRSELKSATANDYLRNHLSTVVSLRNLAYVTRYDTTAEE
jgi:type II secretory pathway pseudopilin PulG